MAELLPSIGASGDWTLKPPFDTKYTAGLAYSCRAINKISSLVATGVDVFNTFYVPNDLTVDKYNADVAADLSMVTLQSSSGQVLILPSTYLSGWPSADSVPYVVMGMVINLGAIPNTLDPTFLTPKVAAVIKAALGHDPDIQYATLSETTNKTWDDHTALENLRLANITDDNSDYIKRLNAESDLAAAQAQIAALQQFIIQSGLTVPSA
ncbi:hypothetical protein [Ralstonia phage RSF1]|uniref:Uncharacterized protein n=1 Tax=Ralstonia phage RSF1 TaxID=1689679 RepID=A0A0K2QQJ9_9CAUD|nr:hypothetical protein AVU11_gp060 [Ralstonia phage RSF1]BAS04852.1 hypothetical protein [Ralstonia phage RSF1]